MSAHNEQHDEFAELMQRVREGSEDAAREMLNRYGQQLFHAVRRRLSRQLRSRYDSGDFVQAVWASFFRTPEALAWIDRPELLAAFLARMANNKVVDEARQYDRPNQGREIPIDLIESVLPDGGPTPSQVAVANEQAGRLVADQPPHYGNILELRTKGATLKEVADQLGISERTVRRVLQKFAERMTKR